MDGFQALHGTLMRIVTCIPMGFIIKPMTRKSALPVLFLLAGLMMAGVAIFADHLGLDQHTGWGRLRVVTLVFGISTILCTLFYLFKKDQVHSVMRNIQTRLESQPSVSRLKSSQSFIDLSGFIRKYWITFPALIFVILIYVWLVSSGTWTNWVSPTQHYADLARGFQRGNLYLPIRPDPRLFDLPNPYDPQARTEDMGIDITFYNGRLYLYWGPVPALLLVAISPFTHGRVGDLQLVFGFMCGIFLLQSLLLIAIWDRFFKDLPKWMLMIPILLGGLTSPTTFMLNHYISARIYEAAISGGQFFFFGGLVVALSAPGRSSLPSWRLGLAGTLWALAIGTRPTLALPVGFMALMIAYRILAGHKWSFLYITKLIPLGLPLMLGLFCFGWYNWARFGSVTETGLYYQLAGVNIQKYHNDLYSPVYILQNLRNYLLTPFGITSEFPFVYLAGGLKEELLPFYSLPPIYASQFITGLLYTFSFGAFAIIPAAGLFSNFLKRGIAKNSSIDEESDPFHWIIPSLIGSFLAGFGSLLIFFWVALRYLEDFMPSLVVLSVLGFWLGYRSLVQRPVARRLYSGVGIILAGLSILISTMLAISINDLRFGLINLF